MADPPQETCWTLIHGAAAGSTKDRDEFVRRYAPLLQAYLRARWRGTPLLGEVEDAVQEIFVACFRPEGVLDQAMEGKGSGFRAYLYGVARNVARMAERRFHQRQAAFPPDGGVLERSAADEASLSTVFDRAFARQLMAEARARQRDLAAASGPEALRRVDLLRLRFEEGLPIRDIAKAWGVDPARLHHDYARAREEFRRALLAAAAYHHPAPPDDVERECARLLDLFE